MVLHHLASRANEVLIAGFAGTEKAAIAAIWAGTMPGAIG
jgi:hypothetical protein